MWKSERRAALFLVNADVSISLCISTDVILKTVSQVLTVQKLITTDCWCGTDGKGSARMGTARRQVRRGEAS